MSKNHATHKSNYISVTRVAQGSYCEKKLQLELQYGSQESDKEKIRRERGNEEHLRHHLTAKRYGTPKNDTRCFIASEIYGAAAPQTNLLRNYRDTVLLNNLFGCVFVQFYYAVSPFIVVLLRNSPSLERMVKWILNGIVRRVQW